MFGSDVAKDIFYKYKDRPVLVYFDPDVDGLFAGSLCVDFLKMEGKDYTPYVNENRSHGYFLEPSTLRGYLVLAVDFEIPRSLMEELVSNDVAVISMDHHDIKGDFIHIVGDSSEGVVINNQYDFEPDENRYLSGAGVVYETLCKIRPDFKSKVREAIVGITLLSDIRPIENPRAREYLKTTYNSNSDEGYIKYLIESVLTSEYGFGTPKLDRNFIDYTLSPTINAFLRFNKNFEAINFVLGEGLPDWGLREKQRVLLEYMKTKMSVLELENCRFIALRDEDFTDVKGVEISNFIGYLCSDIKGTGKSTIVFILNGDKVRRASFRGEYDSIDYRSGLEALGLDARGHGPSFGILGFEPSAQIWSAIDYVVGELNKGHKPTHTVLKVGNISFVLLNKGYDIAMENCYTRDMYRTYIEYTGKVFSVARQSKSYTEYLVNGKRVKCFDEGLDPNNGLILPILEKGYIQLYLREQVS